MVLALRPPRPGDGPALARCWLDAGASYAALNPTLFQVPEADGLAQSLEDRFLHLAATDALVVVTDTASHVVGYLIATIAQPSPRAALDASRDAALVRLVIDALIVRADARHHGVGTQLMDAAEQWGRARRRHRPPRHRRR